jgi:hypothetical protein
MGRTELTCDMSPMLSVLLPDSSFYAKNVFIRNVYDWRRCFSRTALCLLRIKRILMDYQTFIELKFQSGAERFKPKVGD